MFADPRRSRIVLINPARREPGGGAPAHAAGRPRESMALLADALEIFGMPAFAVGECGPPDMADHSAGLQSLSGADLSSFWREAAFISEQAAEGSFVFLGGAWLEEDVLIAALEGVRLGYDVRLLTDLAVARIALDQQLALDRLALHGVLPTTVRQAMLEWAFCLDDAGVRQRVQGLLAQTGRPNGLS